MLTSGIGRRRGTQFLPQLGRDPSRAATRIAGCKDNELRSFEQACCGRRLIYPPAGLPHRGGPILCTPFRTQPGSLCCNISPPSPSTLVRAQPLHAHVAPSSPARPSPRPAHDFPSLTQALRAGCAPFLFSRATALAILSVRRSPRCPNCRQPRGSFCGPSLRRRRSSPRSRRRARVNGHGFLAAEELCERRSPQDRMRGSVYALRRSPEKVEAFSEYSRACSFPDSWQTL